METNDASNGIGIQINGTYDIAVTRQHIRKLSRELRWPAELCMRGIAAMTALAETVYFKDRLREGPLVVYIHILEQEDTFGMELHTDAHFSSISKEFPMVRWHLERVSNELKVVHLADLDHIVLSVLSNGRRS